MSDLDVISNLKKELGIKEKTINEIDAIGISYTLDNDEWLTALNLYNCNLVNLNKIIYHLRNLTHLVRLDLGKNHIKSISHLKELKHISQLILEENQIKNLRPLKDLNNLTQLTLRRNQIIDISPLKELKNLSELNLSVNQITDINSLKELNSLSILDLSENKIIDIKPLKELIKLSELDLSDNQIVDIEYINELKQLKRLVLNNNQVTDVTSLNELRKLTMLYLLNNKIVDITPLKNLPHLTDLNLGRNHISSLNPLKELKKLKTLWLIGNEIQDPSILCSFTQLEELSLGESHISSIPFIKNLKNLKRLDIQDNYIKNISQLKNLKDLERLNLENNDIEDISSLKDLKKLTELMLMHNPIIELPSWITDFNMDIEWNKYGYHDGFITFFENPLESPPIEIVKKGKNAIMRFFEKIVEEGIDFIYEAKLTLVGEGSAGKTSLQRRLLNEKAPLPRKDKRTRGIEINDWHFKKEKGKIHIAHIWDFGGQDVYYPVHRFFITENSVFTLLASTRQTHHNFDYWIPTIYQFGGKSPIILGQTCHEGNKISWNDLGVYISNPNFNIIKTQILPYYEINLLNNNEGLQKIRQTIINQISGLPRYGRGVPKSWVPVRNVLSEESKISACIPFERFKEICKNSNSERFSNITDITDCCQFLHDIGVVLWYSNNDELKDHVILQPEWAMNAVYRIIDDDEIQKRRGNILAKDFKRLWNDTIYENKHSILKKMLEVFKIAFPKKHKLGDYIIPARLLSMPIEKKWLNTIPYLRLEYRYEFMPRGMVNQISAELSRYIVAEDEVWNNAVNFHSETNTALCQVEEDFYNRNIIIKANGKDARGIIILVMNALKNITEGYKGVKPEIYVPCTCKMCITNNRPTTFLYNDLLRWSSNKDNARVICNESGDSLFIEELLYTVGLPNPQINNRKKPNKKTISIFLASSSELVDDRQQFEIFINRENKRLNKEGIFLNLELWEDFIDTMSQTKLQDEYKNVIKKSDIFICLFFTKVGKYTNEEFEIAFGQFKITRKPLVYTYFKDADVKMSQISKNEINSKFKFEEKLKLLGHYPTSYKDIDALKYQFKMQLEKIIPDL